MGWQDRDYDNAFSRPASARLVPGYWPHGVTLILLIVHTVAFIALAMLLREPIWGAYLLLVIVAAHPASIVLHPFTTTQAMLMLLVLLTIWSLGGQLERVVGWRRILLNYVVGNLAAGVVFYLVARAAPRLGALPLQYPIGAVGAWFAIAWCEWRTTPVTILGWTTTVARLCALSLLLMIGFMVVPAGVGAVAWLAGGAAGVGLGFWLPKLRLPRLRRATPRWRPPRRAARLETDDAGADDTGVDEILAKISRSGLASLTPAERKQLEAARRAKQRRPSN